MKLIVYDSIEKKNELEDSLAVSLTPKERLLQMLDWMDFLAAIRKTPRRYEEDDEIDWIILHLKNDKQPD